MTAALVAELRKVFSTRIWWVLLLVLVVYLGVTGVGIGVAATVATSQGTDVPAAFSGQAAAESAYSVVSTVGYVFPLIIGSLAITTEYRHQTITPSFLVEPRRHVVLLAKLGAVIPVGLLYGAAAVLAVVAGSAPLLAWQGDGAYLTEPDVLAVLGLGMLVMGVWAVLGCAVGTVLTNQVAAVVAILVFTQFVEPVARVGLGALDVLGLAQLLPNAAADAVVGASFFAQTGDVDLLPRWAGLVVLCTYTAMFALVGWRMTVRRDIG